MFLEVAKVNKSDTIFIFNFDSERDCNFYMTRLHSAAANIMDEVFDGDDFLLSIVHILGSRLAEDSREGIAVSTYLYADEFCDLSGIACGVFINEWSDDISPCEGCDGCDHLDESDEFSDEASDEELPEDWRDRWTEKR